MKTKYRQYEISKDRVEFVCELKDALQNLIDDIKGFNREKGNEEYFKGIPDILEETIDELENEIMDDEERVNEYEKEEYESEVRSLNFHDM